jgi:hypothetical protein
MRVRLAALVSFYAIIIVPHAHGVLPVGIGVPLVLIHFPDVDRELVAPSLLGALGVVSAILALGVRDTRCAVRVAVLFPLVSLAASAIGFIMASEDPAMSIATASPFTFSAGWLGWWLFVTQRDSRPSRAAPT